MVAGLRSKVRALFIFFIKLLHLLCLMYTMSLSLTVDDIDFFTGTHDRLLAQGGLYAQLVRQQIEARKRKAT